MTVGCGVIQAADVQVSGDIEALSGICCRDKGRCVAAKSITTRYLMNSIVEAGENISVEAEIRASFVTCGGKLVNERGRILGGSIMAAGGVFCRNLGGANGTPTIVMAGAGAALQELAGRAVAEVNAFREKARRAAAMGNKLLSDQKRLTPRDKERATELLFKSYELEQSTHKMLDMIRMRYERAVSVANPEICVSEAVYPGVLIRFPGMEAAISSALRGPLRIAPRNGTSREIVVTEEGGSSFILPTRRVKGDAIADMLQIAGSAR